MNTEISRWYECLDCDRVIECRETEIAPKQCSFCNGAVVLTGEPFQATQFTKYFHGPDSFSHYAGAKPLQRAADQKNIYSITARDLFSDPQSKVQTAVFLRKPLTSARSTRADAPAWLKQRADFLKTFTEKRASRSELILSSFYLDGKTDADIAEMLGWSKDSVKKERATLIKQGNEFFRSLKKHPPNSAIDEEHS